ncbi:MAG TPA: hypothetical protein DEV72_13950 [Ktedonobacter sp.]|jgi:hypothetical protein|nr:hypothetical protein [Ktedonobacter sp.]
MVLRNVSGDERVEKVGTYSKGWGQASSARTEGFSSGQGQALPVHVSLNQRYFRVDTADFPS